MRYKLCLFILLIALAGCSEQLITTTTPPAERAAGVHAIATASPTQGTTATIFRFDGTESYTTLTGDRIAFSSWVWGDGSRGTFQELATTHQYAAPGVYTVQLTIISKSNVWAYDYVTVTVK